MNPFNNYLLQYLSSDIYLVDNISIRINFQRAYSVSERYLYYMCLLTWMCI